MELDTTSPAKENVVEDEDRLNSLPNHIAHNILSYLSIEDFARLSFTSKECEKLCLSVSSLIIDVEYGTSFRRGPIKKVKKIQLMDFLVNFMRGRRGAKLKKFQIRWYTRKETPRIMWLLNHAVECDVHDLSLNISVETEFVMPLDVFCCESLRSLRIDLCDGALEFPSLHGFAHLRSLDLSCLEIQDDSFGEKISSVCKFLEKLSLDSVYGIDNFRISSSSLLELTIMDCSIKHLDISGHLLQTLCLICALDVSMNVYAPKLLSLEWEGVLCDYCFVENLCLLQTIDLSMLSLDHPRIIKLNSLLPGIVRVSCLVINSPIIKALYDDGYLPLILNNLQTLELNLWISCWTYSLVQAIASFLQGLPCNLKKLHILIKPYLREPNSEQLSYTLIPTNFWESQNFRFVQGLEEIYINLLGGRFEVELLEYLIENAKELKKMTILLGSSMPPTLVFKLMAAAVARGAGFHLKGQETMVLELNKVST